MISGKPASDGQPVPCICAFLFDGASDSRFAFFFDLVPVLYTRDHGSPRRPLLYQHPAQDCIVPAHSASF